MCIVFGLLTDKDNKQKAEWGEHLERQHLQWCFGAVGCSWSCSLTVLTQSSFTSSSQSVTSGKKGRWQYQQRQFASFSQARLTDGVYVCVRTRTSWWLRQLIVKVVHYGEMIRNANKCWWNKEWIHSQCLCSLLLCALSVVSVVYIILLREGQLSFLLTGKLTAFI